MPTLLKHTQIDLPSLVSSTSGNLIQVKPDGLFAALQAAANLQNQYVSSSTGNDSNPGTREAPLKNLYTAIVKLPDNTSGNIFLLEGDVFPLRIGTQPEWGSALANFGGLISTGNRNVIINAYGPQTDSYAGLDVNATNFWHWLIPTFNRPIIEFGHYVFEDRPVGMPLQLGSTAGGFCSVRGCIFRWTDEARAAAVAANRGWAGAAYQWMLEISNAQLMGCVLPAPITGSSGNLLNNVMRLVGDIELWNCSMPGNVQWTYLGNVSRINIAETGTMTDRTGKTYPSLPNTIATNISSRIGSIVRDANGVPRNVLSNVIL